MNLQMVAKYKDLFHQLLLMIKTFARQLLYLPLIFTSLSAALNLADPEKHPYANPNAGREGYDLAGETVNEARVYDFYQRQADYYMDCLLYTSPSPRDRQKSRMPSSA